MAACPKMANGGRSMSRAAEGKREWWARQDSNLQPDGYEPSALTS